MALQPPPGLLSALDASAAALEASVSADASEWRRRCEGRGEAKGSVRVRSRQGAVRGDAHLSVASAEDARTLFEHFILYENRVRWDTGIATQQQIRVYGDLTHSVNAYTVAGSGGVVQPRLFVEARRTLCSGDLPFTNVCVDWSLDDAEANAELPKNGRDHIRARNLAGSGCLLRAGGHRNDGRISVVLTMVGRSELGGWLPSVVVERATYGAYRDILSDGVKALQNAGMDVRFEVHL